MPVKMNLPKVEVSERSHENPDFMGIDPDSLDPNRHYRWVRVDKRENMLSVMQAKMHGYQLETHREGGPRPYVETETRPDNVIAVGDAVLMSCPKDKYEARDRARQQRTESLLAAASAQTLEMAREKGISIIKDPDHT